MSNFEDGSYGSIKGIALIAKVLAGRCPMRYTRVAAGKGYIPEGETPKTMTSPAEYVMDAKIASISNSVDGECQVTIQINSTGVDVGFYCTGLLLYAEDPDEGEVPYTYLSLENEPEWVRPKSSIVGKLSTFDIIAAVGDVDTVVAAIDPEAITTVQTAKNLIAEHDADPNAHGGIASESCVLVKEITIPKSDWKVWSAGDEDAATSEYQMQIDIIVDNAYETMFPTLALSLPSLTVSGDAVLCPSIRAKDGFVRLGAKSRPSEELKGAITLLFDSGEKSSNLPAASDSVLGCVKVREDSGLTIDSEGLGVMVEKIEQDYAKKSEVESEVKKQFEAQEDAVYATREEILALFTENVV